MTELLAPIPHQTLAFVLDQVGPAGPLSPRHRLGDPREPNVRQRVELAVCGYTVSAEDPSVIDSFRPTAETILAPTSVVDLRIWQGFESAWTHVAFRDLHGIGVTDSGTRTVLTGPVEPADLAALIVPLLAASAAAEISPGIELELHATAAMAAGLAAALDAARQAAVHGAPIDRLPIASVLDAAVAPIDSMGAGSLRLHTRVLARETSIPDREEVGEGLRRLAAEGVIDIDQTSVSLSAPLAGLARLLPTHVAGFRWQRRTIQDDGALVTTTDRIVSFGNAGLIVEVGLGATGHVGWRVISVDEAQRNLATELALLSNGGRRDS